MRTPFLLIVAGSLCGVVQCETCPSGWVASSLYCYLFNNNDTVTWSEAQDECSMRMAHLLRIETLDEWTFIKNTMVNVPSRNGFWTLLNDRDSTTGSNAGTGTWLWGNDETPLTAVLSKHWNMEPDNNDNEDCVAISLAATLSDEHCSHKMGFICELDNSDGECPIGWKVGPTDCFLVSNASDPAQWKTWDEANSFCEGVDTDDQGKAHLLTLDNPQDSNYFSMYMPTSWFIETTQKWWTDLTDKQTEGTYQWMNGDTYNPNYVNWTREPDNIAGREHCGAILQDGDFSDRSCGQGNNYICRRQIPGKQSTSKFGCGDWERAGHKCYQVYDKPRKSWSDANIYCKSVGARLMRIGNMDEMNWLSYQAKTVVMNYGGYWIGLSDSGSSDSSGSRQWRWTDDSVANTSVLMWNQEPDNLGGDQDCAAMGTDGVFMDASCKVSKLGFICEKILNDINCPSGWLANSTRCYYIGTTHKTWEESNDACSKLSGDNSGVLLAINTGDEKAFILSQLDKLPSAFFWYWTSLTDIKVEGLWEYTNLADNTASAMNQIVWNSEPNNWHGEEHCAATAFGGRLNDEKCSGKIGFICEKYATGISDASTATSTSLTCISLAVTILFGKHVL